METRQLLLTHEHAFELGADKAPVALNRLHPWKHGIVVDRRIAHLAECQIDLFRPCDDPHEKTGHAARALHRLEAFGPEFLDRTLAAVILLFHGAGQ